MPASSVATGIGGSNSAVPISGQASSTALTWVSVRSPSGVTAIERKSTTSATAAASRAIQARSASSANR
ncbi:MAG: hypothetical protein KJZ59_06215 [Pararhodobacter sp.]|nr:hypothetical protein [Pararhodobacter sp.]